MEKLNIILQGNEEEGLYGIEQLMDLDNFFKKEANETTLNDRRYALLQILENVTPGKN